jgi:AcrR family transcriptional regulator
MNNASIENDDTRNKILKAALELFSKSGFDAVSTRKIAQIAGCNIASLNYHFGTKKKLYQECILVMEPKTKYELDQILRPPYTKNDFESGYRSYCITVAEFIVENASSLKLLINEINSDNDFVRHESFLKPLTKAFEEYLKIAKDNKIINPHVEVVLFSNMVVTAIMCQKLYKSFQTYENITNEELAVKIIKSSTSNFYLSH